MASKWLETSLRNILAVENIRTHFFKFPKYKLFQIVFKYVKFNCIFYINFNTRYYEKLNN